MNQELFKTETNKMITVTYAVPTMDGYDIRASREYEEGEFEYYDGEQLTDDVMVIHTYYSSDRFLVLDNERGAQSCRYVPELFGTTYLDMKDELAETHPAGDLSWEETLEWKDSRDPWKWVQENVE